MAKRTNLTVNDRQLLKDFLLDEKIGGGKAQRAGGGGGREKEKEKEGREERD
jgi:hypothetical protein